MDAFFLPVPTLLQWCEERNEGDTETFGIINPGNGIPLQDWPIATDQEKYPVVLSLQDILDECEEKFPDYLPDKLVVFLELKGDEENGYLSFVIITAEVVEKMQRESLQ